MEKVLQETLALYGALLQSEVCMFSEKKRVLVTGATGFVGRALCFRLLEEGCEVRVALRAGAHPCLLPEGVVPTPIESLGEHTSWSAALSGIDTVVHLAARVHIMSDPASDPLAEFMMVNAAGTERLAREAAKAGLKRLVFVSSIKVNGEESSTPYTELAPVAPIDPYGISKSEAEKVLRRIEAETGLEVVVVRPTLVYGPGVKANFLNMLKVVQRGIPLPLACIDNRRSLVYIGNLVDALVVCLTHPAAAGETFLVSDGEDVSTPDLLRLAAAALGVPSRLFPVPLPFIGLAGCLTGKGAAVRRLTGSLVVNSENIRRKLGWKAPYTLRDGLQATAQWYLDKQRGMP